jgi:uncharacterized protein YkwD
MDVPPVTHPTTHGGAHRAPSSLGGVWIVLIVLGIAVTGAGTGMAMAQLSGPRPDPPPDTRVGVAEFEPAFSPSSDPTDAAVVTQQPEPSPSATSSTPTPGEPTTSSHSSPAPADPLAELASEVVDLTNEQRRVNGCGDVTAHEQLAAASTGHSQDMADRQYFDHTSPEGATFTDRAAAQNYHHAVGENIALGYHTADDVMAAWMASEGHRANILNCQAASVGVGVGESDDGTLYWTQVFGSV